MCGAEFHTTGVPCHTRPGQASHSQAKRNQDSSPSEDGVGSGTQNSIMRFLSHPEALWPKGLSLPWSPCPCLCSADNMGSWLR